MEEATSDPMTIAKSISKNDIVLTGATGLCAGANLRTPIGERRVEFLRKGDLVVTRDNGLQPVRLIWQHEISEAEIAADPSLAPVHLNTRAIGPMMPSRPLKVGGAHRLLIPGWRLLDEDDAENCLVPARDVDGVSLGNETEASVATYYNIVFDEPQVFCANGMPVESFVPCADTLPLIPADVQADLRALFPNLGPEFAEYPAPPYKARQRVSYTPNFA
ncbi:MAG: Hint domain-containing protein [Pseudomonadota bacterium]